MLHPLGHLIRIQNAEHISAFKAAVFTGIQICAVDRRAAAVGRSAEASGTELHLMGGNAVFPAQHIGLDDDDLPVQVVGAGYAGTILVRQGCIGDALNLWPAQLHTNLLCLIRYALTEQFHDLRIVVAGDHFTEQLKQAIGFAQSAHVFVVIAESGLLTDYDLKISDVNGVDDFIIPRHSFFGAVSVDGYHSFIFLVGFYYASASARFSACEAPAVSVPGERSLPQFHRRRALPGAAFSAVPV